jgi:hypothetical protein
MKATPKTSGWWSVVLGLALTTVALPARSLAQDQDDPPTRVARIGYMEGSVSFLPAGETDWVGAGVNRPMTTGDQLWADRGSRAELQMGSASIRLSENTGISFLNLDDNTVQIQLTAGTINISVRQLGENDAFEIDTPNQAFTILQSGRYRVEASADGNYTVVSVRVGEGEATGNGQTYDLHSGQRGTFSGTDTLTANLEPIYPFDDFDGWSEGRDHRYDTSRSAQYLSHDVVGYDDLDDHGDWRDDSNYGHVWYPQVEAGWAPYRTGHWDWIDPWGYTWVDDSPWGYAPFHYGRWISVGGRWGWIPGPVTVQAVYAPALVVFIGGGGGGWGGNVGWFPLGPREVYVPSYAVSAGYMNRVNISNTTVSTTVITNVYNTTVINKTTNVTNITYANRNVQGAVTAVPQHAFASAQPVAKAAVAVNAQQIAAAPVSRRVAVAPTPQAVLGARASTAGHVTAPPTAVMRRQVIAKKTPPPPPVPFAARQRAMAAHPGVPLARHEVASIRPAASAAARPMVKQAPPGKPATPTMGKPANQTSAVRSGQPAPAPANQPAERPGNQPPANERTVSPAQPNRAPAAQPAPAPKPSQPTPSRPEINRPVATPPSRPATTQPAAPPARAERPPAAQPTPASKPSQPAANRPAPTRPPAVQPSQPAPTKPAAPPARAPAAQPNNRPEPAHPVPTRSEPAPRPATPAPPARPPQTHTPPPPAARPAAPPAKTPAPKTPEEKKSEQEKKPGGL